MMPISIRSNEWAIGAGANRANQTIQQFNLGLREAGKGFEQATIIGRLKQEEDEYIKRQKLQETLNKAEDFTSMPENFGWDKNGQIVVPEKHGGVFLGTLPDGSEGTQVGGSHGVINRLMPDTIEEPVLKEQAQNVVNNVPNTTVARAAETAGVVTGYASASEQDKGNSQFALMQGDKIMSAYNSATTRRNGLAATIAQMEQVPENQRSSGFNAMLGRMQQEFNDLNTTIRNLKDEGINKGLNPNFFIAGDGSQTESTNTIQLGNVPEWDKNYFAIQGKLTDTSTTADIRNYLREITGKEPTQEEINHIKSLNDESVKLSRSKTQFSQSTVSASQGIKSGERKNQQDEATLQGRKAELDTSLRLMNKAKTIDDKAAFIKGNQEMAVKVGGFDSKILTLLLGKSIYSPAEQKEIETNFEVLKSKLQAERNTLGGNEQKPAPAGFKWNSKGKLERVQ